MRLRVRFVFLFVMEEGKWLHDMDSQYNPTLYLPIKKNLGRFPVERSPESFGPSYRPRHMSSSLQWVQHCRRSRDLCWIHRRRSWFMSGKIWYHNETIVCMCNILERYQQARQLTSIELYVFKSLTFGSLIEWRWFVLFDHVQ